MNQLRTAIAFTVAAISFALYPAMRGYGDKAGGADAAEAFASINWLVAHQFGIIGFIALAVGLSGLHERAHRWSLVAAAGLLPYYGAEAYGLHALGAQARADGDLRVLEAADAFRYEPIAVTSFAVGLIALAVVGVLTFQHGRRGRGTPYRVGSAFTGLALATYLPQFFAPGPVRIVHGLVLAIGLLAMAIAIVREPARRPLATAMASGA